jgi:hypothetical protein
MTFQLKIHHLPESISHIFISFSYLVIQLIIIIKMKTVKKGNIVHNESKI